MASPYWCPPSRLCLFYLVLDIPCQISVELATSMNTVTTSTHQWPLNYSHILLIMCWWTNSRVVGDLGHDDVHVTSLKWEVDVSTCRNLPDWPLTLSQCTLAGPVYTGMPLECHWLTQCYTGIPLGVPANTCRVHWNTTGKNLAKTAPHWNATGET